MRKMLTGLMAAGLFALAGAAAHAADSKTIAVSIPAADHGWTGGVVYHAQQEAKALEARYPGLKVIVKTSPDGAACGMAAARAQRWSQAARNPIGTLQGN